MALLDFSALAEIDKKLSAPIVRNHSRTIRALDESSTVSAANLGLKLRALNRLLLSTPQSEHHHLDFDGFLDAGTPLPTLSDGDGLPTLFLVVADFGPLDVIPTKYLAAYRRVLEGDSWVELENALDSQTLKEPSCAKVLRIIKKIDAVLGTSLWLFFQQAEDAGKFYHTHSQGLQVI